MFEAVHRLGRIGTLAVPNRIVLRSTHLDIESCDGAGLIILGGSAVNHAGAAGCHSSFINDESDAPRLRRVVESVHAAGGRAALQLVAGVLTLYRACEMSDEEIWETIALFARGAFRALQLGFDGIEIDASEGSLIDQFLSPLINRRSDDWGGDAARRRRFGLEILRAIRRMLGPDLPVIFRILGADPTEGGTPREEVLAFARALAHESVDAIGVGAGRHESPNVAAVKSAVGALPVIAGNHVDTLAMAEDTLAVGSVDFVSMTHI